MKRKINLNSKYRHFKGNVYKIICIAKDSEDLEEVVVYQDITNAEKIWTRKLTEFLSEVDHEKYPDVKQKYRCEEVDM